jgi:O-antigen ligase
MSSIAYAAVWLFSFVLPWEGVVRVANTAIASRLTGMLAMGCAVFAVLFSGRLRRWHSLHVAALVFVLTAAFELLVFHPGDRLPDKFYTYVQLFLVLWIVWEVARSRDRMLGLLLAYVLGAYVAAFMTLLVYRSSGGALRRFAAGGVDPNDLAMKLSLALSMAWYLGNTFRHRLLLWICRGYLPVAIVAIGLTGSRGGMLAGIVALTIVPLSMTRLSPKRLVMTLAMLFLAGGLAVVYVPEKIVQRLSTTSTEVEDLSVGGRFKLWRAGFRALPQHPILGFGTSSYIKATSPELGSSAKVAHNSFISVLVEQGIVGLTLFLLMFLAVFRAVRQLPQPERRFGLVLFCTLVVAMSPLTWEQQKSAWFVLAALVGLANAVGVRGVSRQAVRARPGPPLVGSPITRRPVGPVAARPGDGGA